MSNDLLQAYYTADEVNNLLDEMRANTESLYQETDRIAGSIKSLGNISQQVTQNITSLMGNVFSRNIRDMLEGKFMNIVNDINRTSHHMSNRFEKQLWGNAVSHALPSSGSNIHNIVTQSLSNIISGFRARGGPVASGNAYVVGERGPELFVPGSSGTVVPSGQGAPPVNVTMNINTMDSGSFAKNQNQILAEMNMALSRATRHL